MTVNFIMLKRRGETVTRVGKVAAMSTIRELISMIINRRPVAEDMLNV